MAQLPNDNWLVQSSGSMIFIVNRHTEKELVRVDAKDRDAVAKAQLTIHLLSQLDAESKAFAHFWFGYFYAHLAGGDE
jgi:hypothetical protein